MNEAVQRLINLLEVERLDKYLFVGRSPRIPARVFGGQVLAQSLNAASRTVGDERIAHSLHAYFLRPGDPAKQIIYDVDPIRDGRSFATRRVVAKQDGVPIFNTAISFQLEEPGLEHQFDAPSVPLPESLESDADFWAKRAEERPGSVPEEMQALPVERWPVKRRNHDDPQPQEPEQYYWFRVPGELGDNPIRHQTLLAYLSDYALLGTALLPHPYTGSSKGIQVASLDHALWFHRPFRANEYLLYAMDSPTAVGSRGLSRGSFYTRQGALVASTAQESLMRLRSN